MRQGRSSGRFGGSWSDGGSARPAGRSCIDRENYSSDAVSSITVLVDHENSTHSTPRPTSTRFRLKQLFHLAWLMEYSSSIRYPFASATSNKLGPPSVNGCVCHAGGAMKFRVLNVQRSSLGPHILPISSAITITWPVVDATSIYPSRGSTLIHAFAHALDWMARLLKTPCDRKPIPPGVIPRLSSNRVSSLKLANRDCSALSVCASSL
jgi:hypothetical protein